MMGDDFIISHDREISNITQLMEQESYVWRTNRDIQIKKYGWNILKSDFMIEFDKSHNAFMSIKQDRIMQLIREQIIYRTQVRK